MKRAKPVSLRSPIKFKSATDYVQHFYDFRKSTDAKFGYATFAKECSLRSASYLQMVLAGKRTLSLECAHRIAGLAKMSATEHEAFECLALRDLVETDQDKNYYSRKLSRLKKSVSENQAQIRKVPAAKTTSPQRNATEAALDWRLMPLIAVLAASPEDLTRDQLVKRLQMKSSELDLQLDALIRTGVVEESDSVLRMNLDALVVHDPNDRGGIQRKILQQLLNFSQTAFETSYATSKFYSHTFTADPKRLGDLHGEIRALFENLTAVGLEQKATDFVQVNLQCFDLFNAAKPKSLETVR